MEISPKMNILVVEDSDFMRKLFVKYLYEKGFFNITLAEDGSDALQKMLSKDIDLIISDWNMPNMNGHDLLTAIRVNDKFKDIPFIMATAQGEKEKTNTALEAGANGHITKPFSSDQLKIAIDEAFGIKHDKKEDNEIKKSRLVNGKLQLNIGHIQITDHIILGILKDQIDKGIVQPKYFDLNTFKMPGWNPVQQSLESGEIDGAFILAPIAMDLFAYDIPIKLVMLAHKNGSVFVRSKLYNPTSDGDFTNVFKDRIVNIPHKLSIHNLLAHQYLKKIGLKPGVPDKEHDINVTFEVIPPVMMPKTLMMSNNVAGFIVAEPIGSNAVSKGIAEMQFVSSDQWNNHPCCVVTFREEILEKYTNAIYEFTSLLIKAGEYSSKNKAETAVIARQFLDPENKLGLSEEVLKKILEGPSGVKTDDLYPVIEDFDRIQRYMHDEMNIGKIIDLEKFIDFKFVDEAVKK